MNVFSRLLAALLILAVPLIQTSSVLAQSEGFLVINKPDISAFPTIQLEMDAHDAQGNFIENIKPENVWLVENDQKIRPESVKAVQNGLQVIIALNTSPWMATQLNDLNGYQQIQKALSGWIEKQPAGTPDDFSLSTPTGLFLIRERDPERAAAAIRDYQPELLTTQPSLGSLAEALDLASDPLGRPMMKRSILYITPALTSVTPETINDLVSRARGTGARLHVWMVTQSGAQASAENPLRALADATGGQYLEISLARDAAPLPDVEPLLAPLRYSYQVRYTSEIQKGGSQRLSAQLDKSSFVIDSNEIGFELDVQSPKPMFLSPPATIERAPDTENPAVLAPEQVSLQILVEFPDELPRPLHSTRLYVDGQVVAENTSPPFDRFDWPIGGLTTSGRHQLRVEAVDSLGLSGVSIDTPIEVVVEQPAQANISSRISGRGMIAIGAIAAAGIALALVLGLSSNKRRLTRKRLLQERRKEKDPVTQPVKIKQESSRIKKQKSTPVRAPSHSWSAWKHVSTPAQARQAAARLVALNENEEPVTGGALLLSRQEMTFGSDPKRATQVLESPTVDGLHARLYRTENGDFILCDQDSTAGTWINYAPITSTGVRLEHGDLIHIGKVVFRFELTEPGRIPVLEVERLDQQP